MVRVRRLCDASCAHTTRMLFSAVHDSSVEQRNRGCGRDAHARRVRQIAVVRLGRGTGFCVGC
eukprot:1172334-Pleurochrysis_carterae.AAC.1